MHQVKDSKGGERQSQLQFYLKNVLHMAKVEDMLVKNYARLRVAKEGLEINWATLYIENLPKGAPATSAHGKAMVLHCHLWLLVAMTNPDMIVMPNSSLEEEEQTL